ncbi:MAG: NAD-dependent epimerase/dehydratase family protein [Rhodobacteraceae bacterium]|nr:NAD-dependent epimerase/dehydratase family protein [Paracoccaceae bacterium]
MNILIIGGTSLIGPHVIRELSNGSDNCVWTLTRTGRRYFCETGLKGDRNDQSTVIAALAKSQPDVIVDMIPFNAKNIESLISACKKTRTHARVVALSSIDVYSAYGRLNNTEVAPYQPSPIYEDMALRNAFGPEGAAYDKIGVERVLLSGFEHTTLLRLPAIYGWPDTTRVEHYLEQMLCGATVISMPQDKASFRFSRCLHKNAAFAVALAVRATTEGQRVYNIAEETAFSELEWAQRIGQCCGWKGRFEVTPWSVGIENPRQQFEVATKAARQDLGFYEKYNVVEGLSDTVAFYGYQRLGKDYQKYY